MEDAEFAISGHDRWSMYDGLNLKATYKSTNYLEASGGMDISTFTNVEGSYANVFVVTNTDESDENWAYGLDVKYVI